MMFEQDFNIRISKIQREMKLREGESRKQWEKRTERLRFEEEKVKEDKRKAVIDRKNVLQKKKSEKYNKAHQVVYFNPRSSTYLENLGLLMSLAELRYKIDKKILFLVIFLYNKKTLFLKADINYYLEMHNIQMTYAKLIQIGVINYLVDHKKTSRKNELLTLSSNYSIIASSIYNAIINAHEGNTDKQILTVDYIKELTFQENLMKQIADIKTKKK